MFFFFYIDKDDKGDAVQALRSNIVEVEIISLNVCTTTCIPAILFLARVTLEKSTVK